jgi:lipopolysaccharide biosynthesis protein
MYRLSWDSYSKKSAPAVVPDFNNRIRSAVSTSCAHITLPPSDKLPLVVILHCFYPECLSIIGSYLARIRDYDLILNLARVEALPIVHAWADSLLPNRSNRERKVTIRCVENCGRDIKEFWNPSLNIPEQYTAFLKIHTKRSMHKNKWNLFGQNDGALWLIDILESLIPVDGQVESILDLLRYGAFGAIFPVPWRKLRYTGWSCTSNLYHAQDLLDALKIPNFILLYPLQYPIGNMFWGSTVLLEKWSHAIYHNSKWPSEPVEPDGTLLHALERLIGVLYNALGHHIAYSSSESGRLRIFSWSTGQPAFKSLAYKSYSDRRAAVLKENKFYFDVGSISTEPYGILYCFKKFSLPKTKAILAVSYIINTPRKICEMLLFLFSFRRRNRIF